jgi:tetratricopeptide (TPR) repeat protein
MGKGLLVSLLILLLPCGPSQASNATSASQEYRTANDLFASARFEDALVLYRKLLASPPEHISVSDLQTRIGDSYFRLEHFEDALESYRAALRDQKDQERPATQYWIGFCCFLLGRDVEAVEEFLKIPRTYPHSGMWVGTAYYWAGRASERLGRTAAAVEYYRKAGGNGRSTQGKFALKKEAAVKRTSTKSQATSPE